MLLPLLISTDVLRGDRSQRRWRDLTWLSWLAVAIYLVHNVEEYGVDLLGQVHAFPNSMCTTLSLPLYPFCPIPSLFFLAVNLPLLWVAAPLAAVLSRRHALVGLSLYGVMFVNALAHLGAWARFGYNPGALTALVLFLPISIWVARACFGERGLPYSALLLLVADGVILHIILIGSILLFLHGKLSSPALLAAQIGNAALFLLMGWLAERWRNGALARFALVRSSH